MRLEPAACYSGGVVQRSGASPRVPPWGKERHETTRPSVDGYGLSAGFGSGVALAVNEVAPMVLTL